MKTNAFRPYPFVVLCVAALFIPSAHADLPRPISAAFDKGALFTVAGYAGSSPLSGFPVLVRIAANSPSGFAYGDLHNANAADLNAIDLAFIDMNGNGLPFEIDTWNTSGESLIWVRLPTMENGTQFVMCWGGSTSGKTVCNDSPFAGYVGVWHMSEASGTVADSSGHGLNAVPTGATSVSVSVSGKIGNGRQNATSSSGRVYLQAPNYDSLSVGSSFVVSGWFDSKGVPSGDMRLVSRKFAYDENGGWEVLVKESGKSPKVRGGTNAKQVEGTFNPVLKNTGWQFVAVVYNGTTATTYQNGASVKSGSIVAATDNGKTLGIGSYSGGDNTTSFFIGDMDEVRLRPGIPANAADWVKAEYDSMNDAAFLTASTAESYGASSSPVAGVQVSPVGYTNATVVVSVSDFGTGGSSADVVVKLSATSDLATPIWTESYSATAIGSRSFDVSGLSTNATYFVGGTLENDQGASTVLSPVSFTTLAPGAPEGTVSLHDRDTSSISVSATVASFGAGSASASVRLEISTDAFATTQSSAWENVSEGNPVVLAISSLSPLTAYDVRLRIRNEWGIETVLDLGRIATLPSSGVKELYVDSLGNGNGTSPESALPTIREAVDLAGPGFTIWVRGGEGRAYGVSNETDTLQISAELGGLSICAYTNTPGDGGHALVTISDTYINDGNRAHVISNAANSVTVSGLDFLFGITSLGKQNVGSCSLFRNDGAFATLENCVFRTPTPSGYTGSGAGTPLIWCKTTDATNLVVRGCGFYNTRCWSIGHGYAPIHCMSNAQIVDNVFSNVNSIVIPEQHDWRQPSVNVFSGNISIISNIVYGANEHNISENYPGMLRGVYAGPTSAEVAYNRFVFDRNARSSNGSLLQHKVWMSFGEHYRDPVPSGDATLIHHNTFVGGKMAFLLKSNKARRTRIYSNLILLDESGTNLVENATSLPNGQTSAFVSPSCIQANAWMGDAFQGGAATEVENYDLEPFLANNVKLSAQPDFLCTDDIYNPNFYRYRSSHDVGDLGRLGWTGPDGTQPSFVGALSPLFPSATVVILK